MTSLTARRARAEALAEKLALMQSPDIIVRHIDEALRAEREACAKVADSWDDGVPGNKGQQIAQAIRGGDV